MWADIVYEGWIYHVILGFFISALFGSFWWPLASLGFVAGYAKEMYDFYDYGRFDDADMLMTWLGATPGTILAIVLYIAMKKRFSPRRRSRL